MATIYVAPTEPKLLQQAATHVSQHPERFGVDILIVGTHHIVGIQRKEVADLVKSIADGRLQEQSVLMQGLQANRCLVLIEGPMHWTNNELRIGDWGETVTRTRFRRLLQALRIAGIHVSYSINLDDTLDWVDLLAKWADTEHHTSLEPVAAQVTGDWAEQKQKHYQMQMLMGIPGIGKGLAERIIDTFGGLPFTLKPGLGQVKGLGKNKLAKIRELFDDEDEKDEKEEEEDE